MHLNSTSEVKDKTNMARKRPGFIGQYSSGLGYVFKGMAYIRANPWLKKYLIFPFALSFALYVSAFILFTYYSSALVSLFLPVQPEGWFYQTLWYLLQIIVYACVLTFIFFSSVIVTNIICSPFYDYVSKRIEKVVADDTYEDFGLGLLANTKQNIILCVEELKKALFILLLPTILAFIPIIGPVLSVLLATVFIAWEYVDFSLSRDKIILRSRLQVVFSNFFFFLGFGTLLVVPILNLFLFPVAIVGASLLYQEHIKGNR